MNTSKYLRILIRVLKEFLILAFLGNVISLFLMQVNLWTVEIFLNNCLFSILIGYPAWKGINYINLVLDRKLPWLKNPVKRLLVQVFSMTLFVGLAMSIGMFLIVAISEDITFQSISYWVYKTIFIGIAWVILSLLVANAILFFKNWRNAAIQQEELKRARLAVQYESLKNQVKPHFLFNSFSSLVTLINTDSEKATEFVHKLSDVYRYLLEQRDSELVPVSEELKFTEDYIFLQKIRFGENLLVDIKQGIAKNRAILPLSLQMMVENAIKHNEISEKHPLHILIHSGKDNFIIIENNRNKKTIPDVSLGLGLENMKKRIGFFTDQALETIEENGNFTVRIPTLKL